MMNPGKMRVRCKGRDCKAKFEIGVLFRPPCLAKRKGRPRDTMIDLAPLPIALTKPRRLSTRHWDSQGDNVPDVNQVVNTAVVADATI